VIGIIFLINCVLWTGIQAPAPVFNLQNCDGGCKSSGDCPPNAACIPMIQQTCGLCLCTVGYTLRNGDCVANVGPPPASDGFGQRVPPKHATDDSSSSRQSSSGSDSGNGGGVSNGNANGNGNGNSNGGGNGGAQTTSAVPSTTSQTQATTTASNSNNGNGNNGNSDDNDGNNGGSKGNSGGGGGGGSSTFDCNRYKCDDPKDCPDTPPNSVQCPNLAGGGQCVLGSCLKVNSSLSYCLCPYARQSRTCYVKKTGNCNSADGKMPADAVETKGKRFRHIRDPENGAVLARHAVDSLSDCVRLCQWATYQQCRSINFGTINGQKTCELLTVWANKESILYQWLKDDQDWTYVCCFK